MLPSVLPWYLQFPNLKELNIVSNSTNSFRMINFFIEKITRGYIEIIAYFKELYHRRKAFSGNSSIGFCENVDSVFCFIGIKDKETMLEE